MKNIIETVKNWLFLARYKMAREHFSIDQYGNIVRYIDLDRRRYITQVMPHDAVKLLAFLRTEHREIKETYCIPNKKDCLTCKLIKEMEDKYYANC